MEWVNQRTTLGVSKKKAKGFQQCFFFQSGQRNVWHVCFIRVQIHRTQEGNIKSSGTCFSSCDIFSSMAIIIPFHTSRHRLTRAPLSAQQSRDNNNQQWISTACSVTSAHKKAVFLNASLVMRRRLASHFLVGVTSQLARSDPVRLRLEKRKSSYLQETQT